MPATQGSGGTRRLWAAGAVHSGLQHPHTDRHPDAALSASRCAPPHLLFICIFSASPFDLHCLMYIYGSRLLLQLEMQSIFLHHLMAPLTRTERAKGLLHRPTHTGVTHTDQ